MKKRSLSVLAVISMLFSLWALPAHGAQAPAVSASAAVLMEAESGRLLFSRNEREQLPMASTTKIMTALLTLEQPDREVTITEEMVRVEGSSMGLRAGDRLTLHGLAAGMLAASGNDAANAAAILIDGSLSAFAERMNRRAQELGLADTHFVTPSGLDSEGHYSTARDMALLARAALENEDFQNLAGQTQVSVSFLEPEGVRYYSNHNKLLGTLEGCIGGKTGYTKKAGRCLVSAAQRDGVRLIAVTLNDPDDWRDHETLMEYGFSLLERYESSSAPWEGAAAVVGGTAETVPVSAQGQANFLVPRGRASEVQRLVELPRFLYAPVKAGDPVGAVSYRLDGEELARIPLLAGADVPLQKREKGLWERLADFFHLG